MHMVQQKLTVPVALSQDFKILRQVKNSRMKSVSITAEKPYLSDCHNLAVALGYSNTQQCVALLSDIIAQHAATLVHLSLKLHGMIIIHVKLIIAGNLYACNFCRTVTRFVEQSRCWSLPTRSLPCLEELFKTYRCLMFHTDEGCFLMTLCPFTIKINTSSPA